MKMKIKKEYSIVKAVWELIIEPEYKLLIRCPNKKCNKQDFQFFELGTKDYFNIDEGKNINRVITCPYCRIKFRLKVKSL